MSSQFFFDPTNLLILPATLAGAARYGDWRGSYPRADLLGVASEAVRSAVGTNTMAFFIPTKSQWKIHDVQALLLRHGIKLWGVGYWNGEMYFSVKRRQAHWAQYVMLRAGVPLQRCLLSGSRAVPNALPVSEEAAPRPDAAGGLIDWLARRI
jgi:hypothetical protein